jgi:Zn-dependent protease with chaperone function
MILAYLPRLLCVSLATLFLVHLTLGIAVSLIARPVLRLAESMRPRIAARCLLILRLLPAVGAVLIVAAFCLPSYLWLEPEAPTERVGFSCLAAALLGAAMWGVSLARGLRAAAASRRFMRNCRRLGIPAPLLALGGILRPRLLISRAVLRVLTAEQLAAALRHERAHWTSRDNLKRLCMLLTPGVFPFTGVGKTLERGWRKFAEWAADDRAAAGSARRSLALAAALVQVARLTADSPLTPLVLALSDDADQLAARVARLLRATPAGTIREERPILATSAILLIAVSLAVALLQPAALYSVHLALERLME